MSELEICCECKEEIGKAGIAEDSNFIEYEDGEVVGPLCDECRNKRWVCEGCGVGVRNEQVTYEETHEGCGGACY